MYNFNYIKDNDGNKYFSDQEKCNLMENTWKDVFRMSEEEDRYFDARHSDHIDSFININHDRVNTFQTVNLNRINTDNYHNYFR